MTNPTPSPAPEWAKDAAEDLFTMLGYGSRSSINVQAVSAIITKHAAAISEENLALERERDKAFAYIHSLWLNGQLPAPMTDSLRILVQKWGEPPEV